MKESPTTVPATLEDASASSPAPAVPKTLTRIAAGVGAVWRQHRLLVAIIVAYAYFGHATGVPGAAPTSLQAYLSYPMGRILLVAGAIPLLCGLALCRLRVRDDEGRPIAGLEGWRRSLALAVREGWLTRRLAGFLIIIAVLPLFFWAFAAWKSAIPSIRPFSWDPAFSRLDALLHGGQPDRLLAPLLERPGVTRFLDLGYYSWRFVLLGVVLWQGWQDNGTARLRFWLAFLVTWILLGTVAGTLFSSAGPCYYQQATGETGTYGALFSHLQTVASTEPIRVLRGQQYLWQAHLAGHVALGGGISAFPSLHVAMPVLASFAAWSSHRWLAGCFAMYASLIWLGSIHLGWHYAVDGEASLIGVAVIWWVTGRLVHPLAPKGC